MSNEVEYYDPSNLSMFIELADSVAELAHGVERRIVVEVWDRADTKPLAWIEYYPDDSAPTVRFVSDPDRLSEL